MWPCVPHRLEQRVGEAQRHQVLHRLLPEVMVDAVDLLLAEDAADRLIECPRGLTRLAERLFDHHPRPRRHEVTGPQPVADRPEQVRPHGEVEDADPVRLGLQHAAQIGPARILRGIRRHIAEALEKPAHHIRRAAILRHMVLDGLLGEADEVLIGERPPRAADDARTMRDLALQVAVEQGRQQLPL
jgi:hypothetical protein